MSCVRKIRGGITLSAMVLAVSNGIVGCGNNVPGEGNISVAGNLVWQDGTPAKELEGATIHIETSNMTPSSGLSVKADGAFGPMGVPPGTNRVRITPAEGKPIPLDPRFQKFETSGLTYTAWDSTTGVTIKVEKSAE
ncbi:MAG: hypothetical protein HOL01_00770 [Planctomycetaceae bacterium]|jgi:hypothetical protein|nr:hypothetical protein [Planctomycetaceae bacterium]MBT6487343.1 hypothetical protein [Planctomycetaceae bacterium]MBT6493057.1 hypothetical protein [Planctomycetaceae bacterium]